VLLVPGLPEPVVYEDDGPVVVAVAQAAPNGLVECPAMCGKVEYLKNDGAEVLNFCG